MRETVSRKVFRDGVVQYTLRGSEYGMCAHRHVAYLRGLREAAPSPEVKAMFQAGNDGEAFAKRLLDEAFNSTVSELVEFATGWENQTSVTLERRNATRVTRLVCSPDGLIRHDELVRSAGGRISFPPHWKYQVGRMSSPRPRYYALEVKCYGRSSFDKLARRGEESNETLEWQTSGVANGYAAKLGEPVGVVVMALLRLKDDNGYYLCKDTPPQVWVYDSPRYTAEQCLDRCDGIIDHYEAGRWVPCTSKAFCRFPHHPAPVCDSITARAIETAVEHWEAYNHALRDLEGLMAGLDIGTVVPPGWVYARELRSVPVFRRLEDLAK